MNNDDPKISKLWWVTHVSCLTYSRNPIWPCIRISILKSFEVDFRTTERDYQIQGVLPIEIF